MICINLTSQLVDSKMFQVLIKSTRTWNCTLLCIRYWGWLGINFCPLFWIYITVLVSIFCCTVKSLRIILDSGPTSRLSHLFFDCSLSCKVKTNFTFFESHRIRSYQVQEESQVISIIFLAHHLQIPVISSLCRHYENSRNH